MTLRADDLFECIARSLPNATRMSSTAGDLFLCTRECGRYSHVANSNLYAAMGYTTKGTRSSGLTRRRDAETPKETARSSGVTSSATSLSKPQRPAFSPRHHRMRSRANPLRSKRPARRPPAHYAGCRGRAPREARAVTDRSAAGGLRHRRGVGDFARAPARDMRASRVKDRLFRDIHLS